MKRLVQIIGIILLAKTFVFGNISMQLADSAKYYYEKNQFSKAINCYEEIIKNNYSSAFLHYNLGNAYYKNNQLGLAIYHYELARKEDPGNEDIRNNLSIAAGKVIDKVEVKENFFAGKLKSGYFAALPSTQWAYLTIVFFITTLLFYILYTSRFAQWIKKISFWLSGMSLLLFVICLFSGYTSLSMKNNTNKAVILSPVVQVLAAPNAQAKSKFSLHEGTRVKVLDCNENWISIQLENGNEGWVLRDDAGLY